MCPEMAVYSFASDYTSLWSSGVKNLGTTNVNCSCSFKGGISVSCDPLWRFLSRSNPSIPENRKQHRKVTVMGLCMKGRSKHSPAHWLHSRMEKACFQLQPLISQSEKGNDKTLKCTKSDYLVSTEVPSHPMVKSLFFTMDAKNANIAFSEREQPIEEPWLFHSTILSQPLAKSTNSSSLTTKSPDQSMKNVEKCSKRENIPEQPLDGDSLEMKLCTQSLFKIGQYGGSENISEFGDLGSDIFRTFSFRNQPVEEPWLLEPSLSHGSDVKVFSSVILFEENTNISDVNQELSDQLHQVTENLSPKEENGAISQKESVPTVILINSSVCTMQRIAVLEDGKLVELLLEPVKNNVLCDSIYLGVVTKLVPHMGGAFVNIGSTRPSLMDIKSNREPFIFPPFRDSKEKEANGAVFTMPEVTNEIECVSQDAEVADEIGNDEVDDNMEEYSHDENDLEEEDIDIEALNECVNGSLSGHVEGKVNPNGVHVHFDKNAHIIEESAKKEYDDEFAGNKWGQVRKGTKVVVQVVKEGLGTKGPTLTAYPKLRSRFWVLSTRCDTIGISKKLSGVERTRLRVIAKTLQPEGFGLTVRTVAAGHSLEELRKDLDGLISTWKDIMENAKSAALAADEGVEGALPVILHRAMGQTLSVVQDYFNEKVDSMIVDSPRTYHEVTNYLQQIAPDLCGRVVLHNNRPPLFDEYKIEEEISNMLNKWVSLDNGGYLVIEQTEALVSIDVNGGQCMLGQGTSQENAILDVNLAAAKQIAREIRLRDIGGIIVVDFIDMIDDANKRLVYEEVKKAVERDRSTVKVSELSKNGLMEITRKRVRPSVTFMISEPCTFCHGTGRVEALETSFSKIEHEICRLLAMADKRTDPEDPKSWPRFILRVDRFMCNYLTSGKRTRLAILSSSLKVWILLKVARGFTRGAFEVKPLTSDKDYNNHRQVAINMLRPNAPSGKVTVFPIKKWKSGRK